MSLRFPQGCALVLALQSLLAASAAHAGFMQDFSGNTAPQKLEKGIGTNSYYGVDSIINFAVLELETNDNGGLKNKTDPWGTGLNNFTASFVKGKGSAALDTKAEYLYLYQITNERPAASKDKINGEHLFLPKGTTDKMITSFGYFDKLGLSDLVGPVSANNFFGNEWAPGNPAKAFVGVTNPGVVALPAGSFYNPTSLSTNFADWDPPLGTQARSTIFGFTSNGPPVFATATVSERFAGGVVTARGMAPAPEKNPLLGTPEPSSLALAGSALVSLLGYGWRRRKRIA